MENQASWYRREGKAIQLERRELLPRKEDKLIPETSSAAMVDPLGLSDLTNIQARSPIGRSALYSQGYLLAGDRLVEGLTMSPIEDALIYPIFYLYRHHLELELKGLTRYCLNSFSEIPSEEIKKKIKELDDKHGLGWLWKNLRQLSPGIARVNPEADRAFESLLFELDRHDPNSQAARYSTDKKDNQTLSKLRSVDLDIFSKAVHKMSNYLDCIYESIGEQKDWRSETESW